MMNQVVPLLVPRVASVLLLLALLLSPAWDTARAQADPRTFPQTGYRVDNDAFWSYFQGRGELATFGYPVSRAFPFLGCTTQFFQRLVMQQCGSGGVGTLNLLDEGLLPYTSFNGSVVPAPDAGLKNATPRADDPNYGSAILAFVRANASDTFEGESVNFQQTFFSTISPDQAGTSDSNILGLLDLEVWGAPTSPPARDPNNANFIYQRFQRGIMHYDRGCGCTRGLLLADYLKAVITGQNLPGDLADQARSAPLLNSAVNGRPPAGTDYGGAFNGVNPPPTSAPPPAEPTSAPAPEPQSPLGRAKEAPPGQVQGALGFTEPRGSEHCTQPSPGGLAVDIKPGTTRAYPDVFTLCLSGVVNLQDPLRLSVSPNGGATTLRPADFAGGWKWPPNGPIGPGTYTVTATQSGTTSDPQTLTITEPKSQRVLVFPRRGTPGTTFDVYLGGFPKNQPAVLRVYRCENTSQGCQGNETRVYVTSLPPIAVDGAGRAKAQLKSLPTDPKTEFALLSDDMARRVAQSQFITDDEGGVGKAWFCTAPAPTCQIERD